MRLRQQASPPGLGVAVVFDWALTAQLTTQAIAASTGHLGLSRDVLEIAGRLVAALLLLGLGEAVRRGSTRARSVQIAIMLVITVLGLVSATILLTGRGDRSLVLSTVIELTYAPWLAWRLSSRDTAGWYAVARDGRRARRTAGPTWIAVLVAWSVVWGVTVAWSQSL